MVHWLSDMQLVVFNELSPLVSDQRVCCSCCPRSSQTKHNMLIERKAREMAVVWEAMWNEGRVCRRRMSSCNCYAYREILLKAKDQKRLHGGGGGDSNVYTSCCFSLQLIPTALKVKSRIQCFRLMAISIGNKSRN